jgi:hypothetical protein
LQTASMAFVTFLFRLWFLCGLRFRRMLLPSMWLESLLCNK